MAKQTRKIKQRIAQPEVEEVVEKRPGKGQEYFLLGLLGFTLVVLLGGWEQVDTGSRVLYMILAGSLSITYMCRFTNIEESKKATLAKIGSALMVLGVAIFAYLIVVRFI